MSSLVPTLVVWTILTANPAPPAEKSPLSQEQIASVVKGSMGKIKECFSATLKTRPTFEGELDVNFTILADGSVSGANVLAASTARETTFEACVLGHVKGLKFPRPGKKVIVNYPFTFVSSTQPGPEGAEPASADMESVKNVFLAGKESLVPCFGPEGKRDRDARVRLTLTVYPGGFAGDVKHDDQPSPARTAIADCLVSHSGELHFPSPAGHLSATIPLSVSFFDAPAPK
jgi:hypothetical protein